MKESVSDYYNRKIVILVSYHKPSVILDTKYLVPIQVGAENSVYNLKMLKDNTGDNISDMNARLCEITAQYWAWKNVKSDYYGFMHYRRHFVFNDISETPDFGGQIFMKQIDDEYINKIGLVDDKIEKAVIGNDLILTPVIDVSKCFAPNNEIQFASLNNLHAKDFDLICRILLDFYPEYYETVEQYRLGQNTYWYNMYIMRKELFFNYCSWLFPILFEADKQIDYSEYSIQEQRTVAFMAERLFSIYVKKLIKDNPDLKIKHLKMTFVENTEDNSVAQAIELNNKKKPSYFLQEGLTKAYKELINLHKVYDIKLEKECYNNTLIRKDGKYEIAFYGAGRSAIKNISLFEMCFGKKPTIIWDISAEDGDYLESVPVVKPDFTSDKAKEFIWIITITNPSVSKSVKEQFLKSGVKSVIEQHEIMPMMVKYTWKEISQGEER